MGRMFTATAFVLGLLLGTSVTFFSVTNTEKRIEERIRADINDDPLRLVSEKEAELIIAGLKPDLFKDKDSTWFHNCYTEIERLDKSLGYQRFTPTAFEVRAWKGHFEWHWKEGYRANHWNRVIGTNAANLIAMLKDPEKDWQYYTPSRSVRGIKYLRDKSWYVVDNHGGMYGEDHAGVWIFTEGEMPWDVTGAFSNRERFEIALARNARMERIAEAQRPAAIKDRDDKLGRFLGVPQK